LQPKHRRQLNRCIGHQFKYDGWQWHKWHQHAINEQPAGYEYEYARQDQPIELPTDIGSLAGSGAVAFTLMMGHTLWPSLARK